jgi:hypothetical protein
MPTIWWTCALCCSTPSTKSATSARLIDANAPLRPRDRPFLRRPDERGYSVPVFNGLARQLSAGTAGRAEDQEAHDAILRARSIDGAGSMFTSERRALK